jgi:hypothetical protein
MQVIEGTMTMIEATEHLKKAVGASAVEPIIETQGSETFVRFRVQREVGKQTKRWQCAKGCGILPDRPEGSGPYLMGADCSECGSVAIPVP